MRKGREKLGKMASIRAEGQPLSSARFGGWRIAEELEGETGEQQGRKPEGDGIIGAAQEHFDVASLGRREPEEEKGREEDAEDGEEDEREINGRMIFGFKIH